MSVFFVLLFFSFIHVSALFDFSDDTLAERLDKIKVNTADKIVFDAYYSDTFPQYTKLSCEQVDGREGIDYRTCHVQNVCRSLDGNLRVALHKHSGDEDLDVNSGGSSQLNPISFFHPDGHSSHGILKDGEKVTIIRNSVILHYRHLANNFYHRLHDDYLPLLELLAANEELASAERIIVFLDWAADSLAGNVYKKLGESIRMASIVEHYKKGMFPTRFVCFENVWIGAPRKTLWYRSRSIFGPETLFPPEIIGKNVRKTVDWMKRNERLPEHSGLKLSPLYQALLNRTTYPSDTPRLKISIIGRVVYRRILNEAELIDALKEEFPQVEIEVIKEEITDQTFKIAGQAAESFAMVGAHGALLSSAMFMPAGSMLFEIMPYATTTDVLGYYKVLASLPGVDLHYRSMMSAGGDASGPWDKARRSALTPYPPSYQQGVKENKKIPNYKCCNNVFWDYRKGQDVKADIPFVLAALKSMMQDELSKHETGQPFMN